MIDPWLSIGIVWLGSALAMAALWAFSMRVRNVGYVDVGWAGLMALAALLVGALGEGSPMSRSLVAMFGSVWGARLCLHLLHRVLNEEEDGRYQALRDDDEATAGREEAKLKSLNINCLVCHNRNAVIHKWTDGFPQKDTVYGSICRFFDTDERRCTIYEARPAVCREYPNGSRCGYYTFIQFERKHQDDPDFSPSA